MIEPQDHVFYNQVMDKSAMKKFIGRLVAYHGSIYAVQILDQLKNVGFHHSTTIGISLGIDDLLSSPLKTWIIQDAEQDAHLSHEYWRHGCIHAVERLRQLVETWHTTSEFLKREMTISFNILDTFNPVHMMSFSGARGNTSQVHQLVGMRGLMSDPEGNIIDLPIQSNLREGLSLTEYIISCYGARKGVVDTAIRTADAGYLTRRLVQVAQHVVIRNVDCSTPWGIHLRSIRGDQGQLLLPSHNRLIGRVLLRPIYFKERCIALRNQDISVDLARKLNLISIEKILVRSPLTCSSAEWTCQLCYGWGGNRKQLVDIGEAVGIIAGQSIGEPGTQLTLRTFHTGGVFTGDITNLVRAPFNGILRFNPSTCQPTRNRHGRLTWKSIQDLSIVIEGLNSHYIFTVPANSLILVSNELYVAAKQVIAEVRATILPFKETVQRHIYANLQGEVVHTTSSLRLSNSFRSYHYPSPTSKGHVWVWSGQMFQNLGQQVSTLYQSEDYLTIDLPISTRSIIFSSLLISDTRLLFSVLLGYQNLNQNIASPCTGVIRCKFIKIPGILRILILSTKNQFKVSRFNQKSYLKDQKLISTFSQNKKQQSIVYSISNNTKLILRNLLIKLLNNFSYILKSFNDYDNSNRIIGKTQFSLRIFKTITLNIDLFSVNNSFTYNIFYVQKINLILFEYYCLNEQTVYYSIDNTYNKQFVLNIWNKISIPFFSILTKYKFAKLGQLMWKNTYFQSNHLIKESGKIIRICEKDLTLRLAQPFLITTGAMVHAGCYDVIHEGEMLITLMYEQLKTSDIVQGLPKVEQLLESRSMNEIILTLSDDFITLTNLIDWQFNNLYQNHILSSLNSIKHSRIELVNRIQAVYLSQGVHILDKHVEIIVRQMSSKVAIVENTNPTIISNNGLIIIPLSNKYLFQFPSEEFDQVNLFYILGNPVFLPGEIMDLTRIQKMHSVFEESIPHKPKLLGISIASLHTQSFITEASFQLTARVLSKSALQGRTDWIRGLQENVIFGRLIPAGTGYSSILYQYKNIHSSMAYRLTLETCSPFSNNFFNFSKINYAQIEENKLILNENTAYLHKIANYKVFKNCVKKSVFMTNKDTKQDTNGDKYDLNQSRKQVFMIYQRTKV